MGEGGPVSIGTGQAVVWTFRGSEKVVGGPGSPPQAGEEGQGAAGGKRVGSTEPEPDPVDTRGFPREATGSGGWMEGRHTPP